MEYETKTERGVVIKTTVINTVAQLDQSLRDLLARIDNSSQCVVGLDIEKECRPIVGSFGQYTDAFGSRGNNQVVEKMAILKLCYETTCLIIQLLHLDSAPCFLSTFLQLNWISFVGVGIRHCLEALEMSYGTKCRNAVDLGQLAAGVEQDDRLKGYGLLDLLRVFYSSPSAVLKKLLNGCRDVALSNWGAAALSEQQIAAASLDVCICFYMGKKLLSRSNVEYYSFPL